MSSWFRKILGEEEEGDRKARQGRPRPAESPSSTPVPKAPARTGRARPLADGPRVPRPALPTSALEEEAPGPREAIALSLNTGPAEPKAAQGATPGKGFVGNLDAPHWRHRALDAREEELFGRLSAKVRGKQLITPILPIEHVRAIGLTARKTPPAVQVQAIDQDHELGQEVLKLANWLGSSDRPLHTLGDLVRTLEPVKLRSLLLAVAMRLVIRRSLGATSYARDLWRQAFSVATLARSLAHYVRAGTENSFLLGLFHDVGKVTLLNSLTMVLERPSDLTPTLVSHAYDHFHEEAGRLTATRWRLTRELVSVSGNHHAFKSNRDYTRGAALVSLAHACDLHLSQGEYAKYNELALSKQMKFLGIDLVTSEEVLAELRATYLRNMGYGLDA